MILKTLRSNPFRLTRVAKPPHRVLITPLCMRREISMFPRSIISSEPTEFSSIFRLLNEFDKYSRSIDQPSRPSNTSFTPKFDIKELPDSYELHGELPGVSQKDVEIEFTDNQTLTISGHIQQSFTQGNVPKNLSETEELEGKSPQEKTDETSKRQENIEDPKEKFWIMERSTGEFSRSFTFPTQVDENNIKATMNNGVLYVNVPKIKRLSGRKISIE